MNQNKKKTALVTLGTTKFEDFIKKMDSEEILEVLKSFGYKKIVFQIGKGEYEPSNYKKVKDIEVEVFRLKPSLIDDIKAADVVISHCGAGTLLECLRMGKKIIGVNNPLLMHNHQMELLEALESQSYLLGFASPSDINAKEFADRLKKIEAGQVKNYPEPKNNVIQQIIDEIL